MDKNPDKKFVKSEGIDLPIMYIYLAGRISGNCIDKCLQWRYDIINYYKNYKLVETGGTEICSECGGGGILKSDFIKKACGNCGGGGTVLIKEYTSYPIAFLDALNSKEADSIDAKGLTSRIPSNLIYDKDLMSVERADVIVANMNDYMDEGIEDLLSPLVSYLPLGVNSKPDDIIKLQKAFYKLQEVIINRRPNWGTTCEVAWALYLKKPLILIAKDEAQKEILQTHPFTKRASVIVGSVEELLEKKWLNILYKSISSAIY